MTNKKFIFFWFSPKTRKFVRPEVHVEVGGGRRLIEESLAKSMNSTLPGWATRSSTRRALATTLGLILIATWTLSLSSLQLDWPKYLAITLVIIVTLSLLNFTFRSIFDSSDDLLDERLISLRNRYAFLSYQVVGLLVVVMVAALNFADLDPSRLWLPALATYASIPYLLLGSKEKNFE